MKVIEISILAVLKDSADERKLINTIDKICNNDEYILKDESLLSLDPEFKNLKIFDYKDPQTKEELKQWYDKAQDIIDGIYDIISYKTKYDNYINSQEKTKNIKVFLDEQLILDCDGENKGIED